MSAPLIVTVAPNGAYKQRTDHPALPLSPDELAASARRALDAGAAMLHLHVRDSQGRHSLDVGHYREALDAVRAEVGDDMVLQVTSEAAGVYGPEEQIRMVGSLRPEAVSIGLREIDHPSIGDDALASFFGELASAGTMTQVILYSEADLQRWQQLRTSGVVPDAPWFLLFVLGRYSATKTSHPADLLPFLRGMEQREWVEPWAVCAFGPSELDCVTTAACFGGHVRVGFENNLQLVDGRVAADNGELVAQVARVAAALGRRLATAADVRALFAAGFAETRASDESLNS